MNLKIDMLYFTLPSALFVYGLLQSSFSILAFGQAPRIASISLCAGLGLIAASIDLEHRLGSFETDPANYAQLPLLLRADPGMRNEVALALADRRLTNREVSALMTSYNKRQREAEYRLQHTQKLASISRLKAHLPRFQAGIALEQ